ncbi:MAG: hypothetical protein PW735_07675 [Acidobacteriaceae bacterium]|nr:hypothetical protein [Acidobacteriaceae bacterium]
MKNVHGILQNIACASLASLCLAAGCRNAPAPQSAAQPAGKPAQSYPARPSITAPAFRLFHKTNDSFTLVTDEHATDEQIEAILWQLHDAAHTHSFDRIGIPQSLVDKRDPILWFHLYRGARCASEKYTTGALPCGASYHAAGDYTLGGFTNKNRDEASLLQADDRELPLWPSDTNH